MFESRIQLVIAYRSHDGHALQSLKARFFPIPEHKLNKNTRMTFETKDTFSKRWSFGHEIVEFVCRGTKNSEVHIFNMETI